MGEGARERDWVSKWVSLDIKGRLAIEAQCCYWTMGSQSGTNSAWRCAASLSVCASVCVYVWGRNYKILAHSLLHYPWMPAKSAWKTLSVTAIQVWVCMSVCVCVCVARTLRGQILIVVLISINEKWSRIKEVKLLLLFKR